MSTDKEDRAAAALETIRSYQHDIAEFDAHIKTRSDMIKEIVENTPESSDIEELENKLKEARAQQRSRLMANSSYNDSLNDLADDRDARKSALKHLSDALVIWYTITGQPQIELTDDNAREVIVSAKLGKEQLFQTSLLEKKADK